MCLAGYLSQLGKMQLLPRYKLSGKLTSKAESPQFHETSGFTLNMGIRLIDKADQCILYSWSDLSKG